MKKLIALICALTLAMIVPALAFDDYEDDAWDTPRYDILGAHKIVAEEFDDARAAELVLQDAAPIEIVSVLPLSVDSPLYIPQNIEEYRNASPWAFIPAAGEYTVTIPQLTGVEYDELEGYMIQMVTMDGQLLYLDLCRFADSFYPETGTVAIDFPQESAFCVIAPCDVFLYW